MVEVKGSAGGFGAAWSWAGKPGSQGSPYQVPVHTYSTNPALCDKDAPNCSLELEAPAPPKLYGNSTSLLKYKLYLHGVVCS